MALNSFANFVGDYEASPTHVRWRLGPTSPIVNGPALTPNGVPLDVSVQNTYARFTKGTLSVGLPLNPDDMVSSHSGAAEPSIQPLVLDVLVSHDQGSSWSSVLGGGPLLQLGVGMGVAVVATAFTANFGDRLRLSVVQTDGICQDVVCELLGFMSD